MGLGVKVEVAGPVGRAVHEDQASALEDAVRDGLGQVGVMEGVAPLGEGGLVRGDEHGAPAPVALVHHVEEHVGGVGRVGQVAELVDDEHAGLDVGGERLLEAALASRLGEGVDEHLRRLAVGAEAVLDGPVGDAHGEVGLAASGLALQHQAPALAHELGAEVGAQQRQPQRGLHREVEVLHGGEEGEVRAAHLALQTRLLALGHLLGEEGGQQAPWRPALLLGPFAQAAPHAAGVGQVQALEQGLEIQGLRIEGEGVDAHASPSAKRRRCGSCGTARTCLT